MNVRVGDIVINPTSGERHLVLELQQNFSAALVLTVFSRQDHQVHYLYAEEVIVLNCSNVTYAINRAWAKGFLAGREQ